MTRQQFRLLVIANQLLLFAAYVVREMTDVNLPPELQGYVFTGASVMDDAESGLVSSDQAVYLLWVAVDLAALASAVGLCFWRAWGRSLFLAAFVASLFVNLLGPVGVSANWSIPLFVLFNATQGMVIALAYFSHLRRMFERDAREDEEAEDDEAPADEAADAT